jgi:SAM-dependent methyltransferase
MTPLAELRPVPRTRVSGEVAAATEVKSFYERHPYPPPVGDLDAYRLLWDDLQRRRADHHLHWPATAFGAHHSILVAGCGTSQAAKHAMRWPAARVTGIDFSATGLRCTEELKRKYKLDNLQVRQLSVERAGELEGGFDQVVCTGVLHHLADPGAGLRALRSVLDARGAMHIMVYAPYGRAGVYMLQDFCRRTGIAATEEGIDELIGTLTALPRGHPMEALLRDAPDLRNRAALADALLHPQDRAYSVPQLFDFLDKAELTFGRWIRQAPYVASRGSMARIPRAQRMTGLSVKDQSAAAELFRGTMTRHSLIAYRDDDVRDLHRIDFSGDAWPAYVPVRMPDTICLDQRLPPGASAVLINRGHTYTDIHLPINAREKRLFDSIDGVRTIGQISNQSGDVDIARSLFERLWWHDQVVFDASATVHGSVR